jgi:DNA replication and repair protein RecF
MLQLQNITLYQYKNYVAEQFQFTSRVMGICGNNGQGKTNLLDAIFYLCFSKSYFSKTDAANVHKGMQGMRIEGNFIREEQAEKVVCILRENNKKEVLRNGQEYKRLSQHIGEFPVVMIAPDDVELILGTSEVRRKFIDTLLSQLDGEYLQTLITYNKVLLQRNSLLKLAAERGYTDNELLTVLDNQLVQPGNIIFSKRKAFLNTFLPAAAEAYKQIAGSNEAIALQYYSPLLADDFSTLLATYKQKDLLLQRTTIGIHKDDIELSLHNEPLKHIASQGQRKSLLFALKLAAFHQLKNAKGFAPLLLLDDVFEKLDAGRMNNLLHRVCTQNDGQVFITDTNKDRLEKALSSLSVQFQLIEL